MNNEKIFLYMISAAALCFCLFNILQFLLNYNKTAQTVGTIYPLEHQVLKHQSFAIQNGRLFPTK